MKKIQNLAFLCLFISFSVSAQVSGIVKELGAEKILTGVSVFINKTSISTVSDSKGEFSLTGITPGFVEVVLYKEGYRIFKSPIRIQEGKAFKVTLRLVPAKRSSPSDAKRPRDWKDNVRALENALLGTTPYARRSKIINNKSITFSSAGDTLKMRVDEPLVIDNLALGFKVTYYAEVTDMDIKRIPTPMIFKFDTLSAGDMPQRSEWQHNRENIFLGSERHLFLSMVAGRPEEQGFELTDEHEQKLNADSLVSPNKASGYNVLKLKGRTGVRYFTDDKNGTEQFSWIMPKSDIAVNAAGLLLNERAVEVSGPMALAGLADVLPQNYDAAPVMAEQKESREILSHLLEKVYLQLDKPYYYPGEVMWFKGYVTCDEREYRDSLSRVMYVELIDPNQGILMTRILKIDSGNVKGNFVFPDTVKSGNFYVRAYTNLMKNFGDAALCVRTVPVVNILDRVDPGQAIESSSCSAGLSVSTDKLRYKLREKIRLSIKTLDQDRAPVAADLSVAVTDAQQVVPIPESNTIINEFPISENKEIRIPRRLRYPVERGISFSGQFLNDKGKKEKATVSIIQGKFENLIQRETDEDGFFRETGYQFYDTVEFNIAAKNAKGKPFGRVKILPREIAPMNFTEPQHQLSVVKTHEPQRVISEYDIAHGVRILSEVSVTAQRMVASDFVTNRYGRPNRMFSGNQLSGSDMLDALIGRIVGLKIVYTTIDGVSYRLLTIGHAPPLLGSGTTTPPPEPLIYVDGVFRGGGKFGFGPVAADILMLINPVFVDHIEIINRPNNMINVEGGNGLIAIFMKPGAEGKSYDGAKIAGYYKPKDFRAPDYDSPATNKSNSDYRSTIYWNPSVKTSKGIGQAEVSFFAADLPGKYRVVIEGVTENGEPVRCVQFIEIEEGEGKR